MKNRPNGSTSTLGVVLCGGRSRRYGTPKWEAILDGRRLLDHVIACQRKAFGDVIVVASPAFGGDAPDATIIHDEIEGRGPASGIHAALGEAQRRGRVGIWCLPCDAPFARPELGRKLAELGGDAAGAFPESRGPLGFEPLFGWYGIDARKSIAQLLAQAAPSMTQVARAIGRTELLPLEEVERIAPADLQFLNINTPEDMATARLYPPIEPR